MFVMKYIGEHAITIMHCKRNETKLVSKHSMGDGAKVQSTDEKKRKWGE